MSSLVCARVSSFQFILSIGSRASASTIVISKAARSTASCAKALNGQPLARCLVVSTSFFPSMIQQRSHSPVLTSFWHRPLPIGSASARTLYEQSDVLRDSDASWMESNILYAMRASPFPSFPLSSGSTPPAAAAASLLAFSNAASTSSPISLLATHESPDASTPSHLTLYSYPVPRLLTRFATIFSTSCTRSPCSSPSTIS